MPVFRKAGVNILFIHVPKSAGTTVERTLVRAKYTIDYHDPVVAAGCMNELRVCSPQHMHAELLEQTFKLARFDFIFMIVREPIARFQSELAMQNPALLTSRAEEVERWGLRALEQCEKDRTIFDNHLRPQVEFQVPGCKVYRLEDGMKQIISDVSRHLGTRLPGGGRTRHRDRAKLSGISSRSMPMTPLLKDRVTSFYRHDFDAFGYGIS